MPKHYLWLTNPEDTESNPLTRERLLEWMASTGWIEGHVRKRMSPLDYAHMDDYIQSVWEQICLIPEEKLLEIYHKGKGKFTSYLKALIGNQVYSNSSAPYKENKADVFEELYLDDNQWVRLEEDEETSYNQQFPVIQRDEDSTQKVKFEYDGSIILTPANKLYEYDNDNQQE